MERMPVVFELSAYLGHAPLLLRFTAMLMALPLTGDAFAAMRWRFALALCLTSLLGGVAPEFPGGRGLAEASVAAACEGLVIGMAGRALVIAMQMAGAVVSSTIGLQMAAQTNPLEAQQSGLVDIIFVFAGLVLLLDLGFLHMLLALPPGSAATGGAGLRDAISVSGRAIVLGLVMAAPVAIFNTAVNAASGLANRFLPAFPVSMLAMPLQILAGFALIGGMLSSPALRGVAAEFLRSLGG